MLVLSRKTGEEVVFTLPSGATIRIHLKQIDNGKQVRLAIDAPRDVGIWRGELLADGDERPPAGPGRVAD